MSTSNAPASTTVHALQRLNEKYDNNANQIIDFLQRELRGEKPDQHHFMLLLEKHSIIQQSLDAQFKLHEKPLKTVLSESH